MQADRLVPVVGDALGGVIGRAFSAPDRGVTGGVGDAQDIIKEFAAKQPRSRPTPASERQVMATISELGPFLEFDRTKGDHLNPDFKRCLSGCGCPDADGDPQCTFDCSGTCYAYGQKDPSPDGTGIDCSGLIAQENPKFWAKSNRYGPGNCVLTGPNDCKYGTQQQLSLLKDEGLDDIDRAEDLKAGDVAYFNGHDQNGSPTRVKHVMQLISTPTCGDDGGGHQMCTVHVIQAPYSGAPVSRNELTLVDGHIVKKDGLVVDSNLYMYAGGTPPAGPGTGGEKR